MTLSRAWLLAFAVTQAVECPLYLFALRRSTTRSFGLLLLQAFGASAITHPFVWFAFPELPLPYQPMVACAEAFAVAVEALYLRTLGCKRAVLWSLAANGASFTVGIGLRFAEIL